MPISHHGKIIRMDSKTIRKSGRNAQGVRLLHMEPGDKVAAAVVLAPEEEPNGNCSGKAGPVPGVSGVEHVNALAQDKAKSTTKTR